MTRPKRAFSLVIVIVLGVAAFVVATTLLAVSESAGTRVAHSVQGDHAKAIAEAGMERTRAYLQAITTGQLDFDLALDPNDEANCGGLPFSAAPGSQVLRPQFTDGAVVSYRGKDWTRVAYDGGAYLIRFEDDADDFRTQASWDDYTGNTPGAALNCIEGPALAGADNPFRDRNQTISVTVVGIAPGIDPERAVHRSTLRRMETFPGLAVVAGIQVRGDIEVSGSANLRACSPIASMQIDGELEADGSGATGCACGETRANSVDTPQWSHCTASTACTAPIAIGCQAGTMGTPGPSVPSVLAFQSAPGTDFYFDWAAPDTGATPPREGSCIFRIEDNTLWWWDPEATRGGVRCSTKEGAGGDLPDIEPDDDTDFQQCWTPIVGNIGGDLRGLDPFEVSRTQWRPRNSVITGISAATANTVTGTSPVFPGGVTFRKPNWQDCKVLNHPALAGSPLACATCDGDNAAMEGSPLWFSGDSAVQLTAIPAGIYIFDGDISLSGATQAMNAPTGTAPGELNPATFNPAQWPLMTIATTGDINVNARIILGISGRGDAAWPSIITDGEIVIQANNENLIGGSVWGTDDWEWRGSSTNFFFGELHLNGDWEMSGSSEFIWNYQFPLSGAQLLPTPMAPTQTRSLD